MDIVVTGFGSRSPAGWRGGLRVPHPRSGPQLTLDLTVPREFAADFARAFRNWLESQVSGEVSGEVGDEVGSLGGLLGAAGRLLGSAVPGLIRGAGQLLGGGGLGGALGGLFGGGAPAPPPPPAPRPAPPPPPPPMVVPATPPPVPPLPGLASLLGAGGIAPDLLGASSVLSAAPSFAAISPSLQRVLGTAIRVVDAEAAARLGDPRAREALRRARAAAEERVVRALRLVDAMLDRP